MIRNITIRVQPARKQRYVTAGDYIDLPHDNMAMFIADTGNWKYNYLVALHELVEIIFIKARGIKVKDIDHFDISHPELDDPGLDKRAPYHKEHMVADSIERRICRLLKLKWKDYNKALNELDYSQEPTIE